MIEKRILLRHSSSCAEGLNNKAKAIVLCLMLNSGYAWSENCFTIPNTLPNSSQGWYKLQLILKKDTPKCLKSSVYFALYGASQLNSGQLNDAIESLERALLLDANNGAALIDYASALYYSGQLFSAIDLNEQLLKRSDLPVYLKPMLKKRALTWQEKTRAQYRNISVRSGYDDNLNGATFIDNLTLNFPGQDITLPIEENAKAVAGRYIDVSLTQDNISHSPFGKQTFSLKSNFRVSEDHNSNYFQLAAAYQKLYNSENSYWHWDTSVNYLHYNQEPLTLETAVSVKKQWLNDQLCEPFLRTSLEHLSVIREQSLSSITINTGGGLLCRLNDNLIGTRLNYIQDMARSNDRPGGDSSGWAVDFQWQRPLYSGIFNSSFKYTSLSDQTSYSPLLDNGANRRRSRTDVSLEYIHPLPDNAKLSLMLTQQRQNSNIALFKQRSTRISAGFNKNF
jgi:tetratricopeptide (TPR) repeat protein